MTRDQDSLVLGLFQSKAFLKHQQGQVEDCTFADACSFLDISEDMKDGVIQAQLDYLHGNLVDIEWQLRREGSQSDTLSDGRTITADDIGVLYDIYNEMLRCFRRRHATLRLEAAEAFSPPPALGSGPITREEQDKLLQSLFQSTALWKYQEGRKQEWTFADACRFWGITENMQGAALDARLEHVRTNLADIRQQLEVGTATLSDGRSISADEISMLYEIHNQMMVRFARHLTLLRSRMTRN
jgi:hypothetical protein